MPESPAVRTVAGVGLRRPFRGPFERWPHATDLLIALIAIALTLSMWSSRSGADGLDMNSFVGVGAWLSAFIASFALLWRRTHPLQVHAVVLAVSILVLVSPMPDGIVALSVSLYSVGRYEAQMRASVAAVVATLLYLAFDLQLLTAPDVGDTIAAVLAFTLWYAGRRLRFRGEYLRLLEERALHLEHERHVEAERAAAAERTRIAREMHDVVAHQVSLMTVQAGAARTITASDPEAAAQAMAAVESAGRNALSEMRHLLGVLRPADADETDQALGPQPGIGDLDALVQQVRDVGPEVRLHTRGDFSALPARLELNAYRIVQESLTNVIKHAGANVHVRVLVDGNSDGVEIHVTDDGVGHDAAPMRGHGIVGMRERVEMLGGTFRAGTGSNDGFEVHAVLPLRTGVQ
jgi:signal transduction histidine kinase